MDNQDIPNIKVKRTKEDIRLYNRLYYTHVRKNDEYYQHYVKKYHSYKYYEKRIIKIIQQQVKISDDNLIVEI